MRLGVFGGAFDPVHNGHLVLACECRDQLSLDQVWLIPSGQPPHKDADRLAPAKSRVDMLELATAGDPGLVVSRIEIDREGTSFTVETLEEISAAQPDSELFLLLGADSVEDLRNWPRPERIAELATLVSVNRAERRGQHDVPCEDAVTVSMPGIDICSTDLRHRLTSGRSVRHLVPRAVEQYLLEHQVY